MLENQIILIAIALGYMMGAIPTGYVLTSLTGGGDIRTIGSGGIGATNVLRTGSRLLAVATLIGDAAKAAIAIMLTRYFCGEAYVQFGAIGTFIGHLYPFWLNFRGGKGIAVYIGILFALNIWGALGFLIIYALVVGFTRISSCASLAGALIAPIIIWLSGDTRNIILALILTALSFWTHRNNIMRLIRGEEPRIGQK